MTQRPRFPAPSIPNPDPITAFVGRWRFLSSVWPCAVPIWGYTFLSAEAAYHAGKCPTISYRGKFVNLSGGEALKLSRTLPMREDWEEVKLQVMEGVLTKKFTYNEHLRGLLVATHPRELVEDSDEFWGMVNGKGSNYMGRLLMKIRADLL